MVLSRCFTQPVINRILKLVATGRLGALAFSVSAWSEAAIVG